MNNQLPFLSDIPIGGFFKISILILIAIYLIWVFILLNHIRGLNRIVIIKQSSTSILIQAFAVFYLILVFVLFLAAVAIL